MAPCVASRSAFFTDTAFCWALFYQGSQLCDSIYHIATSWDLWGGFVVLFFIIVFCSCLAVAQLRKMSFHTKQKSMVLVHTVLVCLHTVLITLSCHQHYWTGLHPIRSDTKHCSDCVPVSVIFSSGALVFISSSVNPVLYAFFARRSGGVPIGQVFPGNSNSAQQREGAGSTTSDWLEGSKSSGWAGVWKTVSVSEIVMVVKGGTCLLLLIKPLYFITKANIWSKVWHRSVVTFSVHCGFLWTQQIPCCKGQSFYEWSSPVWHNFYT